MTLSFDQFRNLYLLSRVIGWGRHSYDVYAPWLKINKRLEADNDTVKFQFAGQYVMEIAFAYGIATHSAQSFQDFMNNAEKNFGDGFLAYIAEHTNKADINRNAAFTLSGMEGGGYKFWEGAYDASRKITDFYDNLDYNTKDNWKGAAHRDKRIDLKDCETLLKSVKTKNILVSQPTAYLKFEGLLDGLVIQRMQELAASGDMKKATNLAFYMAGAAHGITDPEVAFTLQRNYLEKGYYCTVVKNNPADYTVGVGFYGPAL